MAYAQKKSHMTMLIQKASQAFRTSGGNPCVGAMLVYNDEIISIGIHEKYGEAHAEVNCIDSVPYDKKHLIPQCTLYVTLEPCCIHSKTPPCTNKILNHEIKHVIVACLDPNPLVASNGVAILKEAGVKVELGVCEDEAKFLIRKFKVNILEKRPFIALKMAISKDGYAGKKDESIWLTNEFSRIQAHKLRGMFEGIVVGYNTVNLDNPALTNRDFYIEPYYSFHPTKIIIDKDEKVNKKSLLFQEGKNIILTASKNYESPNNSTTKILNIEIDSWSWSKINEVLWNEGLKSLLIEGGPRLQKSMISESSWDEAHILSSNTILGGGLRAPTIQGKLVESLSLQDNVYKHVVPFTN